MKRFLLASFALFMIILSGVYAFLFTPWGNEKVASMIEQKANEYKKANFKIDKFVLNSSSIEFLANVDNNSKIQIQGDIDVLSQSFDLKYNINVQDLSKLQQIIGTKLNGELKTKGIAKGNSQKALIDGVSSAFDGESKYTLKLENSKLSDVILQMNKIKIEKLLYMLNQPLYVKGLVDINGKITHMKGKIYTNIYDGKLNNEVINKVFNQKLSKTVHFKSDIVSNIDEKSVTSEVEFLSTLLKLYMKKNHFDIPSATLDSDYKLQIKDLSKLNELAQMKLRGNMDITGDIHKSKDLKVTGISKLLGGTVDFKLFNSDFNANIKNVEVLDALHMLYYPEVFTSKTDLVLSYNLANKKGTMDGQLLNGQFLSNKYSYIINQLSKFDMTKEAYEFVNIKSDIDKDIIKSTLEMKSKLTKVNVPHSTIDNKNRTVNALIKTDIKGIEFDTKVSGNLEHPKVDVDEEKLLKNEIKKNLDGKWGKKLDEKLGEGASDLIKGFFN